jgi:transcriptional regulator NrdR family protein
MNCPNCGEAYSLVLSTRTRENRVDRRRMCPVCRHEWRTVELTEAELSRLTKAAIHAEAAFHARRIAAVVGGRT